MGNVGSSLLATRRERSESEHEGGREEGEGRRLKAGKRTKDESGCCWRGRKESHEMPVCGTCRRAAGLRRGGCWRTRSPVDKARVAERRTTEGGRGGGGGCNWGGGLRWNGKGRPSGCRLEHTGGSEERRGLSRGRGVSWGGSPARGSSRSTRAIPGAALNESAFLCPAMLSKCKQRPIIYHPLRKQLPVPPLYTGNTLEGRHAVSVMVDVVR